MRIAIVGAGAMGSIFGARFQQGGHDTVLVDVAQPLVDAINANGVTIQRGEDETTTRVEATSDAASVGEVDIVVFFTKCYHTQAAAEGALPLVGSDTLVASLQNGWGNGDVLAGVFSPEQVAIGVTYNSGLVLGPGRVMHPAEQPTLVGPFAEDGGRAPEPLAQALGDAGFEVSVVEPVRPEIWKKLILNAATLPGSALPGMTAGAFGAHQPSRDLVADTAREATSVANALGFEIDSDERVSTILALLEKAGGTKGSMLQDFEAGRRTEIDVINGAVVKAAEEVGVDVPINRTFLRLVKAWEAQRGLS